MYEVGLISSRRNKHLRYTHLSRCAILDDRWGFSYKRLESFSRSVRVSVLFKLDSSLFRHDHPDESRDKNVKTRKAATETTDLQGNTSHLQDRPRAVCSSDPTLKTSFTYAIDSKKVRTRYHNDRHPSYNYLVAIHNLIQRNLSLCIFCSNT